MIIMIPFQTIMKNMQQENSNKIRSFQHQLSMNEIQQIIELYAPICQSCQIEKKKSYCMEPKCKQRQLLCKNCDVNKISGKHYMHQYSYLVPLFSNQIFLGISQMKKNLGFFFKQLERQIQKIKQYMKKLQNIAVGVQKQLNALETEEKRRKFDIFKEKIDNLVNQKQKQSLCEIFNGIHFISNSDCEARQKQIKQQLLKHVNDLQWLTDPKKQLKQLLKFQSQKQQEVFYSNKKTIQVSQIDNHFQQVNQYYTDSLKCQPIQVKICNQLSTKLKFYQTFIYHLKNCQQLILTNATIPHVKTPLKFRNLKILEIVFNNQPTNDIQIGNVKLQPYFNNLNTLIIKKMREEDLKFLKSMSNASNNLKYLYIQILNKYDLSSSKQLCDYLSQINKSLVKFFIKIRSENQVKRSFGYLTKFYKENIQSSNLLSRNILQLLSNNKQLTQVTIDGIRPLQAQPILNKLIQMPYLMKYKITYEQMDLISDLETPKIKILQESCNKRKKLLYILAAASKYKRYPKNVIKDVIVSFIQTDIVV